VLPSTSLARSKTGQAEFREIIEILPVIQPEYRIKVLRKLQKLLPTAHGLEETAEKELASILTVIAEKITQAG
jgi:hypothetical protein